MCLLQERPFRRNLPDVFVFHYTFWKVKEDILERSGHLLHTGGNSAAAVKNGTKVVRGRGGWEVVSETSRASGISHRNRTLTSLAPLTFDFILFLYSRMFIALRTYARRSARSWCVVNRTWLSPMQNAWPSFTSVLFFLPWECRRTGRGRIIMD